MLLKQYEYVTAFFRLYLPILKYNHSFFNVSLPSKLVFMLNVLYTMYYLEERFLYYF